MPVNQSAPAPQTGFPVRVIASAAKASPGQVHYGCVRTWLGPCTAAFTRQGLCWLAPGEGNGLPDDLVSYLPAGNFVRNDIEVQRMLNAMLSGESETIVHLFGTDFQLRVWDALTDIPYGVRLTYGELARQLGAIKSARAVGSAIGRNPVAWIVPCHRVVPADGGFGGYRWGARLKQLLLATENSDKALA